MKMMANTQLILLFLYGTSIEGFHISNCCSKKEVGGHRYDLAPPPYDEEVTTAYGCESNCLYYKESMPGTIFCFKTGNLPFHCINENGEPQKTTIQPTPTPHLEIDQTSEAQNPINPPSNKETPPPLEAEQTRIILSWPDQPYDIDLHVVGYLDGSPCRVYYGDKCGCTDVCQDIDNENGGFNGPETVTLQNAVNNANYLYAIGVHDYSGTSAAFGSSQAKIEVTNGTTSFTETLPISSIPDGSWWFFGCISVTPDNVITYHPAPTATTFGGSYTSAWTDMAQRYCNLIVPTVSVGAHGRMEMFDDDELAFPPKI